MSLHRSAEPGFPQDVASIHIESFEASIQVANKHQAAAGRDGAGVQRGSLLMTPDFFHGVRMVGTDLTQIAIGTGHLKEFATGR